MHDMFQRSRCWTFVVPVQKAVVGGGEWGVGVWLGLVLTCSDANKFLADPTVQEAL